MRGRVRTAAQPTGAFTLEALRALRAVGHSTREPVLLGYHPVARTNPYQALLYREAWQEGIAPVPLLRAGTIPELAALARLGHRTLLHLHWLGGPLSLATTVPEAQAAGDAFLRRLDEYLATGGRLAWTVHNVLPHGARFPEQEARLRAGVAERADVLHVLAKDTPGLVAPWFRLPADRVLHVPHPGYVGAYPDSVGRAEARHELELAPDELVFVTAGAIRMYKGLAGLLDAWEALPFDAARRLVIAGAPGDDEGLDRVLERAALQPRVLLHPRRIPVEQMQLFLRAADVAVLPYVESLNSGALLLALSFDLPVIVPAGGGLAEVVDDRFALTFDPARPDGLRDALLGASRLVTPEARSAARAAAVALDPVELSRRFATGLRERLDGAGPGAPAGRP